jgi:hypothetical protein
MTVGYRGGGMYYNDTWSWDGATWTQLFPATSLPLGISDAPMVFDSRSGGLVCFAGNGTENRTWHWNHSTWRQIPWAGRPLAFAGGPMPAAYHEAKDRMIGVGLHCSSYATWEY